MFRTGTTESRRQFVRSTGAAVLTGLAGCLGQEEKGDPLAKLPCHGDRDHLENVTRRPSHGRDHVEEGTDIEYENYPPTSGTHYGSTVEAGFYEDPQPLGAIVHSLEHGAVVIYYEKGQLSGTAEQELKEYTSTYTGPWASVIAMPYRVDDPNSRYALTAWRHLLRLEQYSADVVRSFIAEYLGRGPENNVRECD